jgi:hypothetical protein
MRKMNVRKVVFVTLAVALVVGLGALYRWLSRGALVRIRNESNRTIYIIDIYYRYGSTGPISIDAGKSLDVELGSSAEDHLIIQYIDRQNVYKCKAIDVYMMPLCRNWGQGIGITIDSNDVVTDKIIDLSTGVGSAVFKN